MTIAAALGLVILCCSPGFCQPDSAPKFEVASVKTCKEEPEGVGRKGGNATGSAMSPNRLDLHCQPVRFLIRLAYVFNGPGATPGSAMPTFDGGPAWIDADRYTIEAKAAAAADRATINGPMLRALLEERFQLKVHRETREVPAYALTIAKGGLKLLRPGDRSCTEPDVTGQTKDGRTFLALGCSKLQRAEQALCVPRVAGQSHEPGDRPLCGIPRAITTQGMMIEDVLGADLSQVARLLTNPERLVVDDTGVTEKFDLHLEYALEMETSPDVAAGAPSLPAVLGDLGLKLQRAKGQREFLVIDHIERPSQN